MKNTLVLSMLALSLALPQLGCAHRSKEEIELDGHGVQKICQERACRPQRSVPVLVDGRLVARFELAPSPYLSDDGALGVFAGDELELVVSEEKRGLRIQGVRESSGERRDDAITVRVEYLSGQFALTVSNPFERSLSYCAYLQILGHDRLEPTSTYSVRPGTAGIELWRDPVVMLSLTDFELVDTPIRRVCPRPRGR